MDLVDFPARAASELLKIAGPLLVIAVKKKFTGIRGHLRKFAFKNPLASRDKGKKKRRSLGGGRRRDGDNRL